MILTYFLNIIKIFYYLKNKKYIYYFLGEPIALRNPILKQNPPAGKLNLNSTLVPNLVKPMIDFCEDAAQA